MHTRLLVPVLVGSVLSVAVYAWAASPTDQLRAYTDQVLKVVENSAITLPERRTAEFDRIIRTASYEDLVKRLRNQSDVLNDKEAGAQRTRMPAGG